MTVYSTNTGVSSYLGSDKTIRTYGYTDVDIPNQYMITIENTRPRQFTEARKLPETIIIKAPMQEKFSTRTESSWSPLSAAALANGFNELSQILVGRSLVSKYANRQYWTGTSPLDFTIPLKFEAINDIENEVLRPVIELHRMCLPYSGVSNDTGADADNKFYTFLKNSFLHAPGPDPYTIDGKSIRSLLFPFLKTSESSEESITVSIGTLLSIPRVVMKSINVDYASKMTKRGIPIETIVTINFQTFDIQTKETIDDMYSSTMSVNESAGA